MTALVPTCPGIWLPTFEPWRLLRPLKLDGQWAPRQRLQFDAGDLPSNIGNNIPILDGRTTGLSGAWSMSRVLLSSWGGSLYNEISGAVHTWYDQSGNGQIWEGGGTDGDAVTAGPSSRTALDFNGAGDYYSSFLVSDQIAADEGYFAISFMVDAITTDNASTVWNNDGLLHFGGAYGGLSLRSTGPTIQAYNWDGDEDLVTASISLSTPYVVEWRHLSGNVGIRVNGGSWSETASGNTGDISNNIYIGESSAEDFDGQIFEMVAYSAVPPTQTQDDIVSKMLAWVQ